MTDHLPILYSFRRCPYAMRARLGLSYANIKCNLREVVLRDKPPEMLRLSPKGTVPVLYLPDGRVIDESYDIIKWAIEQNDPDGWRLSMSQADLLITENDGPFKQALDNYKYARPSPDHPPEFYRSQGMVFLNKLDQNLQSSPYLLGQHESLSDIAIIPFVRQFAHVDRDWFFDQPLPHLHIWLEQYLNSETFKTVMKKYKPWQAGDAAIQFPDLHQGSHSPLGAP